MVFFILRKVISLNYLFTHTYKNGYTSQAGRMIISITGSQAHTRSPPTGRRCAAYRLPTTDDPPEPPRAEHMARSATRGARPPKKIHRDFDAVLPRSLSFAFALAAMGRPRGASRAETAVGARFARTDACSGALRAQAYLLRR
jgi:hypothetical protein